MKTTEQLIAQKAWDHIHSILNNRGKVSKEFVSAANGAASLILSVGLGQAVAFWMAKGKEGLTVANFLANHLLNRDKAGADDLMKEIMAKDYYDYRLLLRDALSYLNWLKRFAKAKEDKSDV